MATRFSGVAGRWGRVVAVVVMTAGSAAASVYEKVDGGVVCLKTVQKDGGVLQGSGFFVAEGIVATVAHQVANHTKVVAFLPDGRSTAARVVYDDLKREVAILEVPPAPVTVLPIAPEGSEPGIGAEVFTIGCPMGLDHSLSRGVVSNPELTMQGKQLIQTDLVVNNGNSGGPLLNQAGEVVGLILASLDGSYGINFAVTVDYLVAAMAEVGVKASVSPAPQKISLTAANPVERVTKLLGELERNPNDPALNFALGTVYYELGNIELALKAFDKVVSVEGGNLQARANQGLMLFKLGRFAEAESALIQVIAKDSSFAEAYLNLGMVYAKGLNNRDSALGSFARYLELVPNGEQSQRVRELVRSLK